MDHVRQPREDLGLPAGPAAVDPPDRRRHQRHRGRRGQLRRHHLRQGRVGPEAAGRLGRARRSSSQGIRSYFERHAWGNTELSRPARRPRGDVRSRPVAAGPRSGWRRLDSTRCGPTSGRRRRRFTSFDIVQTAPTTTPPCGRTGSRSASTNTVTTVWSRTDRVELDVVGRAHRRPRTRRQAPARSRPAQRRRPRVHQDPARPAIGEDAGRRHIGELSDSRWPGRSAGPPPGT